MATYPSFQQFAPTVLRAYRRDREAFWAAAMAPFLADNPGLLQRWRDLRTGLQLASAFKGLDRDASQTLTEWSAPLSFDVAQWRSNRPQYFKDAYPIFAFLAVWMDEVGLDDLLARFADILRAGVFAVARAPLARSRPTKSDRLLGPCGRRLGGDPLAPFDRAQGRVGSL